MGHPNGTYGWADVAVPNMDQGKAFYSGLFGWDAVDSPGGESMPYTMFMLDGKTVAGMGPDAGRMFLAIDPVGAAIGFWQAGEHADAGVFNVAQPSESQRCRSRTRKT